MILNAENTYIQDKQEYLFNSTTEEITRCL